MGAFAKMTYLVILVAGLAYVFVYYKQDADHLAVCQKLISDSKTTDKQLHDAGCV